MIAEEFGLDISSTFKVSGESFLTVPGNFSTMVQNTVLNETGILPELSTSGGTSDARFIKNHCPVIEVGLVGKSMHHTDEYVNLEDVLKLKFIGKAIKFNFSINECRELLSLYENQNRPSKEVKKITLEKVV